MKSVDLGAFQKIMKMLSHDKNPLTHAFWGHFMIPRVFFRFEKEHEKLKNSPNKNGLVRETPQDEYL